MIEYFFTLLIGVVIGFSLAMVLSSVLLRVIKDYVYELEGIIDKYERYFKSLDTEGISDEG
jgi:hypothetical protein